VSVRLTGANTARESTVVAKLSLFSLWTFLKTTESVIDDGCIPHHVNATHAASIAFRYSVFEIAVRALAHSFTGTLLPGRRVEDVFTQLVWRHRGIFL